MFSYQKHIAHVYRLGEKPSYKTCYSEWGDRSVKRRDLGLADKQLEINVDRGSLCHPMNNVNSDTSWIVYCGTGRFPNTNLITPLPSDIATWLSHVERPMPVSSPNEFRNAMLNIIAKGGLSRNSELTSWLPSLPLTSPHESIRLSMAISETSDDDSTVAEIAPHVSRVIEPGLNHEVFYASLRDILDEDYGDCGPEERHRAMQNFIEHNDAVNNQQTRALLAAYSARDRFPKQCQVINDARRCAIALLRELFEGCGGINRRKIRQYVYTKSTKLLRNLWPDGKGDHHVEDLFTPEGQANLIADLLQSGPKNDHLHDTLFAELVKQKFPEPSAARVLKRKKTKIANSRIARAREYVQEDPLRQFTVLAEDIRAWFISRSRHYVKFVWDNQCYDRHLVITKTGQEWTCADFVLESMAAGDTRARGVQLFREAKRGRSLKDLKERPVPGHWRATKAAELVKQLLEEEKSSESTEAKVRTPSPSGSAVARVRTPSPSMSYAP